MGEYKSRPDVVRELFLQQELSRATHPVDCDCDECYFRGPFTPIGLHHPTLGEIAQREQERELWLAAHLGGRRVAAALCLLFAAVPVVLYYTTGLPTLPVFLLAVASVLAAVVCGLVVWDNPEPGPIPEPLTILRYTREENIALMGDQEPESFHSTCVCPGCGQMDTHPVRQPVRQEPPWAQVIRSCELCDREWAQR